MDKIIVKCDNQILFAEKGENLLALLQKNGIAISSDCGGKKRCLKCKVKISPQVDSACKQFLDKNEYDLGVRLACFISVEQELTVETIKNSAADILSVDKSGWTGETTKEQAKNLKKFACVDIGTTTVTISVCDENFAHIKTVNFLNPQRSFGADVISRILAADEGHLIDLQRQICDSVYSVLAEFEVSKVVVAANNVMLHLLLGVSPHSIGVSPYSPTFKEMKRLTFEEVFGQGDGEIVLLPSVSGYVGGDIVAGMIATEIEKKNNSLFVDLGTNGEIVLNANGKLFCASTAAGPAFEGGNIACGSYAREKAVAKVEMKDGKIIIDDKDADAICGSGLIDLTAVLVENNIIDEMGGFDTESELVKDVNGEKRVYLNDAVYLSQKDVRSTQLAKAAISCGIKTLLEFANISGAELSQMFVAGGFSKNLNFKSCERIGLIPNGVANKCIAKGNTAIWGALMCLKDEKLLDLAVKYSNETTVLELGADANFFNNYTECLIFE